MGISIILINLSLAFLFGVYLSFHFFFCRLKLARLWRWVGGIVGSLLIGTIMAMIDFWIIWPPANPLATIVGFALVLIIFKLFTGYPSCNSLKKRAFTIKN